MRRLAFLAGLVLAPATAGADDLQAMLDKLAGPPKAPAGAVHVVATIDRNGLTPALVVTLVADGAAKLVGDPGVTVTAIARPGVAWTTPEARHVEDRPYLADPPTLRLAFSAEDGEPVAAEVDYAYCLVDYQCLFGQQRVEAATRAPAG
jgi:hypothetical protein